MLHLPRRTLALTVSCAVALTLAPLAACDDAESGGQAAPGGPGANAGEDGGTTPGDDGSDPSKAEAGAADGSYATSPLVTARPYDVKKSSKYDGSKAVPLVLSLHGYTATAKIHESYFELAAVAEEKNFLVALPDGKKDTLGNQYWNASDACCDFYQSKVDDVAYLKAVIADMKARFNVDSKRVYVVGHSNGGFMAHRLACEMSNEIAAIVSLAGVSYTDTSKCTPTEPVAVLQVHGDADQTVVYTGGKFFTSSPSYPGAKATVAMWAQKNGCDATLNATPEKLDLDKGLAGSETSVARHTCTKGAAELWTIAGGAHIPSFQDAWAGTLYAFLEAHPKP